MTRRTILFDRLGLVQASLLLLSVPSPSRALFIVDPLLYSVPFLSTQELVDAVDVYMLDTDDAAVADVLGTYGIMELWDVSGLTDFSSLFSRERQPAAAAFQRDLGLWDVSGAINMSSMFDGAAAVDFDVTRWNVSGVADFRGMFRSASAFRGVGLEGWDVSSGENFSEMFMGASNLSVSLCLWNQSMVPTAVTTDMLVGTPCPASIDDPDDGSPPAQVSSGAGSVTETVCQPCQDQSGAEESPRLPQNDEGGRRPNVLLLITDQQRFDAIGYVQNELRWYDNYTHILTPNLDRLLSEGVYFRNAYCQCAVCAPARSTLRTGCTIERTGMQHNDLEDEYTNGPLFQERVESIVSIDHRLVQQFGYISEYYGKWHLPYIWQEPSPVLPDIDGETVLRYNDFSYAEDFFFFKENATSSKQFRKYLDHFEDTGVVTKDQPVADFPQIDTYTRFPYRPVQLDTRYGAEPFTPLEEDNGFDKFEVSQSNVIGISALTTEYTPSHFTGDIAIRALQRLKVESAESPWFLTVSFHHPHPPFVAPMEPHLSYYWENRESLLTPPNIADDLNNSAYKETLHEIPEYSDPEKVREWMAVYYALISEADFYIGEVLDALGDSANDTLVIFTSDHGEMLGAHGGRSKSNFYEEATRVPLFMRYPPRINPGTQVDEMVSHLDLVATILDYVGASEADTSDGRSLRPFIEGTEYNQNFEEDVVFGEWDFRKPLLDKDVPTLERDIDDRPCFLVRSGNYKLMMQKIRDSDKVDMMYDLESDPFEMSNLLGNIGMDADDAIITKAEHMRCLLLDWMERVNGDVGYYSDPAGNYGEGDGDLVEVRLRQKWKTIGFWISETFLRFGRVLSGADGGFVRHEHLYLGTRMNETVRVSSIRVSGEDSQYFTVDRESLEFGQNDCERVKVTFSTQQSYWQKSTEMDAKLIIELDLPSSVSFEVPLSLSDYSFGEAPVDIETEEPNDGNGENIDSQDDDTETVDGGVDVGSKDDDSETVADGLDVGSNDGDGETDNSNTTDDSNKDDTSDPPSSVMVPSDGRSQTSFHSVVITSVCLLTVGFAM